MTTRPAVFLEPVELLVEIVSSEPLTECVEDVISTFSGVVQPGEFTTQHRSVQQSRPNLTHGGERRRSVDRHPAFRVDDTGPEPDGRDVSLPDAPHAHHESQAARRDSRLVRVSHHARVAQRRAFDGVLARERRT